MAAAAVTGMTTAQETVQRVGLLLAALWVVGHCGNALRRCVPACPLSAWCACRWFEVNYAGTPAAILDVWFGTYSEL